MNAITSKEFASKKSAQAAARKIYGSDYATKVTIDEIDETWYITEITSEPITDTAPEETAPVDEVQNVEPEVGSVGADQVLADEIGSEDPTDDETDTTTPSNLLADLVGNMTGDKPVIQPPAPVKAEPQKTAGLIIEKDRPMQNGVKRPSIGGLCRAVWDACWSHQEKTGEVPTAKQVKEIALANGWNPNNASIEYYQWRKYNGISGRVAKVEAKKPEAPVFGNPVALPIVMDGFI